MRSGEKRCEYGASCDSDKIILLNLVIVVNLVILLNFCDSGKSGYSGESGDSCESNVLVNYVSANFGDSGGLS